MRTIASDIYVIATICIIMFIIPTISYRLTGVIAPHDITQQYHTMYKQLQEADNEKSRLKNEQKATTGQELEHINTQLDKAHQQYAQLQEESQAVTESMMQYRYYTAIGMSIICIIAAIMIPIPSIQTGLLLGAINTLLYGYVMYAEYMHDIMATLYLTVICIIAIVGMWHYRTNMS